ncbi:TPA: hypothetical protein JMQ46_004236 [Shigella sonnei]|uniref:Uncharacterized protein n=2 Tax=Shigella sonnei TaxID=624 RepID=Q3YTT5_SHISS|nr:conserved hypothetical protein [Shigella sonnei Ss046]ALZ58691.1 hypothetical protein FORC11_p0003 [Shigella sonnei]EHF9283286.1 hypothetical protein [Shigella flexneri]EMA3052722.1 hypothetical protein [Escherichia coli]EFP9081235.1 hypothetical protein [Shigella sonnei]
MPGTTTAMSINFIGMTARTMNSNGSHGKPQIPVDYQKLLSIEDITFCRNRWGNIGENALRRVAVGKKLSFFGSDRGGENAAII